MFSQSELERDAYEARRKWQLDYNTGMKSARMEGREEGIEQGREVGQKIGVIQLCQRLADQPVTPLEGLSQLAERLQEELQRIR